MRNNSGDANVSKMTLIAIVFVVGAILLVLTTSAFRGPIHNWFSKVTNGWFADENGMFEADNAWLGVEQNENGTYKTRYIMQLSNGRYAELLTVADAANGEFEHFAHAFQYYKANGSFDGIPQEYMSNTCTISPDGKTITIGTDVFVAQLPQ